MTKDELIIKLTDIIREIEKNDANKFEIVEITIIGIKTHKN